MILTRHHAEMALLSAIMLDPEYVLPLLLINKGRDTGFHHPYHRALFLFLWDEWITDSVGDLVRICEKLHEIGRLETVGGHAYLAQLYTLMPTAKTAGSFLSLLEND